MAHTDLDPETSVICPLSFRDATHSPNAFFALNFPILQPHHLSLCLILFLFFSFSSSFPLHTPLIFSHFRVIHVILSLSHSLPLVLLFRLPDHFFTAHLTHLQDTDSNSSVFFPQKASQVRLFTLTLGQIDTDDIIFFCHSQHLSLSLHSHISSHPHPPFLFFSSSHPRRHRILLIYTFYTPSSALPSSPLSH